MMYPKHVEAEHRTFLSGKSFVHLYPTVTFQLLVSGSVIDCNRMQHDPRTSREAPLAAPDVVCFSTALSACSRQARWKATRSQIVQSTVDFGGAKTSKAFFASRC